ncbi:hypothetical protein ma280 [Moumouvirus australiensis]|uniref:Uncharacterized protein n=1 Tax=Moumouvirus australiensis TaxID=2109587 RepID=A0A2P1EL89_9VIRU|nr:hypothetical protein QKC55_gp624 [Moumouvirus australiensis]AVL94666.1 hypothetical protein ma280 [Moumouvirus australiensis]
MFVCHFLLTKTLFAIFSNIVLCFYGIIFYYGFIETIIFLSSIYVFIVCKSRQTFKESNKFNSHKIQKINSILNKIFGKIKLLIVEKNYDTKFIGFFTSTFKKVYNHIISIYCLLSKNKRTETLYMKLSDLMGELKIKITNAMIPIFINKLMPPSLFVPPNFDEDIKMNFDNDYKNLFTINNNMDFLNNSSICDFDDVEDLDEVEVTPVLTPVVNNTVNENHINEKKINTSTQVENSAQPTREELRKKLRQRIRSKRGGQPDFDKALESAFTKNNIEKIMKQISSGNIKLN